MTMIDRVARAIRDVNANTTGLTFTELSNAMARAAIEEMRWPTDGMRSAGARRGNWSENELGNEWDCADNVWFAMIDKALEKDMER